MVLKRDEKEAELLNDFCSKEDVTERFQLSMIRAGRIIGQGLDDLSKMDLSQEAKDKIKEILHEVEIDLEFVKNA